MIYLIHIHREIVWQSSVNQHQDIGASPEGAEHFRGNLKLDLKGLYAILKGNRG